MLPPIQPLAFVKVALLKGSTYVVGIWGVFRDKAAKKLTDFPSSVVFEISADGKQPAIFALDPARAPVPSAPSRGRVETLVWEGGDSRGPKRFRSARKLPRKMRLPDPSIWLPVWLKNFPDTAI